MSRSERETIVLKIDKLGRHVFLDENELPPLPLIKQHLHTIEMFTVGFALKKDKIAET